MQGYKTALIQKEIPIDDELIISCETPEETEQETLRLLNQNSPPDSFFAISDLTMTGVMKAINRKNLKVPEDISVIGFCEEPFRSMYNLCLPLFFLCTFWEITKAIVINKIRFITSV